MEQSKISSARKKKIKNLLSMMNKQNQRFLPVTGPLVEMMSLVVTDRELDYLLPMGTGLFNYEKAAESSKLPEEQFESFFDTMKRKGLVHVELDSNGIENYRINAIAVGWYEAAMHYLMGKPEEKEFSEKFSEYFRFFRKFNLPLLRNAQSLFFRPILKPTQDSAIMSPDTGKKSKRRTIPIDTSVTPADSSVYPHFFVNELIEDYGDRDAISVFPCVCRHGKSVIGVPCNHDMPKESCIAFGDLGHAWSSWGYGRRISKEEAFDILAEVRDKGAVHSVIHERDDYRLPVAAICNCCWDCCGILRPYNMSAAALKYKASYTARIKADADCKECGNCEKYCPTTAIRLINGKATLNSEICIGCGQCAYQCRQNNIELFPNERMVYLPVLKKSEARVLV